MTTNFIGENIRVLRENAGLNQTNIAKFLGVDQSLISKIEKNERFLSSDMLDKIATLFGVTVAELLSSEVDAPKLTYAFRGNELSVDDLETICVINRIALNSDLMRTLNERDKA